MFCPKCGVQLPDNAQFCQKCGYQSTTLQPPPTQYVVSAKNRRLGILFLVAPFAGLMLILLAWAVVIFVVNKRGATPDSAIVNIVQWLLGLLGLIFVLSILVGIPLGIIFLLKKELISQSAHDERSGKGAASVVPAEIKGWNWGAAGLTFIWGLYYNVWLSLITFVPIAGPFWWIVLGIKGNEWAWRKTKWESVQKFQESQHKWMPWGVAIFFCYMILFILDMIFNVYVIIGATSSY